MPRLLWCSWVRTGGRWGQGHGGLHSLRWGLLVLSSGLQDASPSRTPAPPNLSRLQPFLPWSSACFPASCRCSGTTANPYSAFVRIRNKHPFLTTFNFHLLIVVTNTQTYKQGEEVSFRMGFLYAEHTLPHRLHMMAKTSPPGPARSPAPSTLRLVLPQAVCLSWSSRRRPSCG